jgi:hypothetical protein
MAMTGHGRRRERRGEGGFLVGAHDEASPHDGGLTAVDSGGVSWEGPDEELLDADAAAALLTVKPSTLRAWAREGAVPVVRLGRLMRWTRPMLRAIVAARTVEAGRR